MSNDEQPKQTLSDGSPVTPDHREINPATGQQKGYVVLSAEERAHRAAEGRPGIGSAMTPDKEIA